jgi:hypothetical protein
MNFHLNRNDDPHARARRILTVKGQDNRKCLSALRKCADYNFRASLGTVSLCITTRIGHKLAEACYDSVSEAHHTARTAII